MGKYSTYHPFMCIMEADAYELLTKRLTLIQERLGFKTPGEALTWWIRMLDAKERMHGELRDKSIDIEADR